MNEMAEVPGLGRPAAQQIVDLLGNTKKKEDLTPPKLKKTLDNIKSISVIPQRTYTVERIKKDPQTSKTSTPIKIKVSAPPRIKLVLEVVDQELFANLVHLLGENYFAGFRGEKYLSTEPEIDNKLLSLYAAELLPAVEHNLV